MMIRTTTIVLIICSLLLCNAQLYSVTITAGAVSITVPWYPGITVANAMIQAVTASNGKFNYAIQYSSAEYGGFITEIGNVASAPPAYWLYSVNGVAAQVGVDFNALNIGDAVLWNFTKTTINDLKTNFIPAN